MIVGSRSALGLLMGQDFLETTRLHISVSYILNRLRRISFPILLQEVLSIMGKEILRHLYPTAHLTPSNILAGLYMSR